MRLSITYLKTQGKHIFRIDMGSKAVMVDFDQLTEESVSKAIKELSDKAQMIVK